MSLTWRLLAPVYDRLAAPLDPARQRATEAAGVGPYDRVLLAGCGTGSSLRHLPPTTNVIAVDRSRAMIERTRRRAADLGIAIDARVGDATALELPDDAVDVVCLHLVLSAAERPAAIVSEAARVLGATGRLSVIADTSCGNVVGLLESAGFTVTDRPEAPSRCVALVAKLPPIAA